MVVYYFNLSNQNQPLEKIQIYKMKKRYNYGTHLKNAINDPKYATQLITAKIATNPIQILQEKIQKSNNIKEIYFSYTVIDKLSFKKYRKKEYLENKEKMLSLLKGKSNTILESKDFATVTNLLNYIIQDYLGYSLKQDLNQLFENLSNSEDEQVKKYASTFLYYQDPSRVELKKEVLQALDISYSSIRYLAIKAIVKSDLSIEDLSKVFNLLTDGNSNVREMVMNKISQMTLEEAHLNILANLSKKELDWDVREFLTKKLGKTKNPLAKKMLIAKLNDTSSLIREEVYEALYEKELVENDLVYLRPLINAKEWDTRKYCLQLITKISGELASIDLAKGLQDKSQLIRDLVYDSLNERKITEKVVSELYYLFYHNEYDVRSKVIQLASKSNLERISEILIEKLDDPSQSIRELAYKLVAARELNTEHIAFIKRKITSKKWDTRNFSIQLMGMINDDTNSNESSVLLILALNDPSQMLRELAFDFLKTRKLQNDSDILSALESMLYKKNNWDSRKFSAIILSKIVSKESLAILEARLPLETSTIIQDEIQNSINLITSEISQI
jgi:HEAT repeat protein